MGKLVRGHCTTVSNCHFGSDLLLLLPGMMTDDASEEYEAKRPVGLKT